MPAHTSSLRCLAGGIPPPVPGSVGLAIAFTTFRAASSTSAGGSSRKEASCPGCSHATTELGPESASSSDSSCNVTENYVHTKITLGSLLPKCKHFLCQEVSTLCTNVNTVSSLNTQMETYIQYMMHSLLLSQRLTWGSAKMALPRRIISVAANTSSSASSFAAASTRRHQSRAVLIAAGVGNRKDWLRCKRDTSWQVLAARVESVCGTRAIRWRNVLQRSYETKTITFIVTLK